MLFPFLFEGRLTVVTTADVKGFYPDPVMTIFLVKWAW